MSERKRLASTIRDAQFKIEAAVSELDEAIEYLDRYEHLQQANPDLHQRLSNHRVELATKVIDLDLIEVDS